MVELQNADEIEKEEFENIVDEVYALIDRLSDADESRLHTIDNLCLVDAVTNSRLNNSVFDVKREIVKNCELEGRYLPVCTRNVFLKAFTSYPENNVYWTSRDRRGYLDSIRKVYDHFTSAIIQI